MWIRNAIKDAVRNIFLDAFGEAVEEALLDLGVPGSKVEALRAERLVRTRQTALAVATTAAELSAELASVSARIRAHLRGSARAA